MDKQINAPLFSAFNKGGLRLKNRIVMTSLTRGRTTNPQQAPTALHAEYYQQRASAGLIISESTWVSESAAGFINLPGIYTSQQVEGWKLVTDAVHEKGAQIFVQLTHSGSVSHRDFQKGALPFGPSAINPLENTYTPSGFLDTETPQAHTTASIQQTTSEFRQAAENAKAAGFDGVEVHAQIFTLIPQFLSTKTNQRTDSYGGSIENRSRIIFEILDAIKEVFSADRIGIKFTPAAFNKGLIQPDENTIADYTYILTKLNEYELAYVQLVGPAIDLTGTPIAELLGNYFEYFRTVYHGTLMANLGFTGETANEILISGTADLVSFGTAFIANPDLPERLKNSLPLAQADPATYYTGGETGYTDYPPAT
jgi:N-ethylmaleimide reductase